MTTVSVAEAKDRLSALISAAEAGETVTITRHGKPVARLGPARKDRPFDPRSIDRITQRLAHIKPVSMTGTDIVRAMRDED